MCLSLYVVFWSPAFHRASLCPCLNERFKPFLKLKEYVRKIQERDRLTDYAAGIRHAPGEEEATFTLKHHVEDSLHKTLSLMLFLSLMNVPEKKPSFISLGFLKITIM